MPRGWKTAVELPMGVRYQYFMKIFFLLLKMINNILVLIMIMVIPEEFCQREG